MVFYPEATYTSRRASVFANGEGQLGLETIHYADRALYKAKELGRNRIEVDDGAASCLISSPPRAVS